MPPAPALPRTAPVRPAPGQAGPLGPSVAVAPAARPAGRLSDGARRLLRQAGRFLLVGGVATVADVGLFNLLHYGLDVGPLTAKVVSTGAGGAVAFAGNRLWSFGDQAGKQVRTQAFAFVVVNAVALLLALVPLAFARYVLGLTGVVEINIAANVVGLGLATVLRFEGYRRWVFKPYDAPDVPAQARRRGADAEEAEPVDSRSDLAA